MARTKHLSTRSSSRPRKRFHFGRSAEQQTPADANRPATPSGATPVREITHFYSKEVNRWTPEALIAIQEAAETHMIEMFEDAYLCAIHAKRVTLNNHEVAW
ncbi:histone H3 [Musa troglodytarum]|uniref:Histone H3 n=1 Tax=Musa troglodytarum TaxID=320322 RepID=A0A9E7KRV6_9LILI|nr:histone H3 [Musa troglodytarum]